MPTAGMEILIMGEAKNYFVLIYGGGAIFFSPKVIWFVMVFSEDNRLNKITIL
jgi:hypothetical protein